MKINNAYKVISVLTLVTFLWGCAAASTAIKKRELFVESKTSHSIILEPVAPYKRIVYASVRDLSGNSMRKPMQAKLEEILRSEGFTVTKNPDEANMMLTGSIIAAGKSTSSDSNKYLSSGYKGGAEGAVIGGILGGSPNGRNAAVGGALLGAASGFLADTLVEDVYFTFVMDVQLRERPLEGDRIQNKAQDSTQKGTSSANSQTSSKTSSSVVRGANYNWIIHETRVVTTANKMNLEIEEAIPEVQKKTAETIAEMLL